VVVAGAELMVVRHDVSFWYCQSCYSYVKKDTRLLCPGCQHAVYCTVKCMQDHGGEHEVECGLWAEEPECPHYSLSQFFRALQKIAKQDHEFAGIIESLVSYEDVSGTLWDKESEAGLTHWIASLTAHAPSIIPSGYATAMMRRTYFALKLNAFNVKPSAGSASRAHASGLFSKLALFNHSCDPNCGIQYRDQGKIRIVAIRPIGMGEELTVSYTNPYVRREVRCLALKKNFFFNCACCKCSEEDSSEGDRTAEFEGCMDDSLSLIERFDNFKVLDATSILKTESANALLNAVMKARSTGTIDLLSLTSVIDLFVDPDTADFRHIRTCSPDTHWNWLVFLVDASSKIPGRDALRRKLAERGVEIITKLNGTSMTPYLAYFQSNLS